MGRDTISFIFAFFFFVVLKYSSWFHVINKLIDFLFAETKDKIVANLANFAYDPYNYSFLRQVENIYFVLFAEPNVFREILCSLWSAKLMCMFVSSFLLFLNS